jgi:hypothetical protein
MYPQIFCVDKWPKSRGVGHLTEINFIVIPLVADSMDLIADAREAAAVQLAVHTNASRSWTFDRRRQRRSAPLDWIIFCEDQHLHKHLHKCILPWSMNDVNWHSQTAWTDTVMNDVNRVNRRLSTIHNSTAFLPFCLWKRLSIDMNTYILEKIDTFRSADWNR